jgi:hypothetical protein
MADAVEKVGDVEVSIWSWWQTGRVGLMHLSLVTWGKSLGG